jgi:hypothetical protein
MVIAAVQKAISSRGYLGEELPVARNNHPQFIPSCVLDPNGFTHLRRISALIWRRTSAQSVVPVVPASSAAQRREQAGQCPVLIMSQDVFNERSGTVIAIALTSQLQRAGFL